MASFQAKIGSKTQRNGEYKNYRSVSFVPGAYQKIPKKWPKKFKNTIMASFQTKIGWKMPRKRKNKNYQSVPFLRDS